MKWILTMDDGHVRWHGLFKGSAGAMIRYASKKSKELHPSMRKLGGKYSWRPRVRDRWLAWPAIDAKGR